MTTRNFLLTTAFACGFPLAASAVAATVNVDLNDDSIVLSQSTVPAGDVIFDVKNASIDDSHELVVVGDASQKGDLPFDKKKDRVPETKLMSLGEVADLKPGASGKLDVKLAAGTYTLICNMKGHYRHGMHTELIVR